jgi:hypothetical protein
MRLFTLTVLATAVHITTIATASASESCPRNFSYEKLNDIYTCTLNLNVSRVTNAQLEDRKARALRLAEVAYAQCKDGATKPKAASVVSSLNCQPLVTGVIRVRYSCKVVL